MKAHFDDIEEMAMWMTGYPGYQWIVLLETSTEEKKTILCFRPDVFVFLHK